MKRIIDISEEDYKKIKDAKYWVLSTDSETKDLVECIIINSTPLTECEAEDCISRKAVFDLMRSLTRWCVRSQDGKFNNVGLLYDDVMFGIDGLSSVYPKSKDTISLDYFRKMRQDIAENIGLPGMESGIKYCLDKMDNYLDKSSVYPKSDKPTLNDFIEYAKREFGVSITVKKSDNPDTFEKLFGEVDNGNDN